ncbi:NADP-dependent malic enzyme-like [Condylostylus longicornis]|uniref:NADP-dependent malic enzyme-like n=1 Tax=Condylostylus longicornis TaxID=2530218 RepID=UPI00244DC657|nr:NADP-dependent malic enzyme-like [Condylostylus longicornis]
MPEARVNSDGTCAPRPRQLSLHRPNHYPEGLLNNSDPASILTNPHYNKGTAFTAEERKVLHLEGLLPRMYISQNDKGQIRRILDNWKPNVIGEVSIIVVTDGSRILGLGDLGACGMGIPVGKLSLYVAAGGFHPATTLPVVIDAGTNNQSLLKDEFYLGQRQPRLADPEYYALVDEFMSAVKDKWSSALLQFEDFSNNHCFDLLEKYRNKQLCFNDDIQGTGAVIAAGFLNALKITKTLPRDCRILFLGAGAAGIGVADQIGRGLQQRYNLSREECFPLFFMVDSKGLVTRHRGDELASFKVPYARQDIKENVVDLLDIVKLVKPTALIGLSGQPGAFTNDVLRVMAAVNKKPIVFPLSNPTNKAECSFKDAFEISDGRVVFASGSPFDPITSEGKTYVPSQGNNLYTFPGLGYGAWLCKAKKVTDEMVTAATLALADSATAEDLESGCLYPCLSSVREITATVAARVIQCAIDQGVAGANQLPKDLVRYVKRHRKSASEPEE